MPLGAQRVWCSHNIWSLIGGPSANVTIFRGNQAVQAYRIAAALVCSPVAKGFFTRDCREQAPGWA